MLPVLLAKIKTRDGITLDGIIIEPRRKSKTALIWIHGLTSYFYSSPTLIRELSQLCQKNGIGYFKFNTRGHDIVARGQGNKKLLGTTYEKFEDCVYDIRAMILFARKRGYKNIILTGHSTGANKALYYTYKTRDRTVKGIILLGPVSDIAYDTKLLGGKELQKRIARVKRLKSRNPALLVPPQYGIYTTRRYLSLLLPGMPEDVFPYHNPNTKWKELRSVKTPLAVIFGSRDQYLDRPAQKIIEIFQKNTIPTRRNFLKKNLGGQAKSFSGIIIKDADHSFRKKEKELARVIMEWVKTNGL